MNDDKLRILLVVVGLVAVAAVSSSCADPDPSPAATAEPADNNDDLVNNDDDPINNDDDSVNNDDDPIVIIPAAQLTVAIQPAKSIYAPGLKVLPVATIVDWMHMPRSRSCSKK